MKYGEFNIDSNKIEFFNSKFGVESVFLNKKIISKKFSFSGAAHIIKLDSKEFILESEYKQFGNHEIKIALKENDKVIETKIVKVDQKHRIYWMAIGFAIGIGVFKLLNSMF